MHKFFLTKSERDVIRGSEIIAEHIGGFPSMEDGCLLSIEIKRKEDSHRYRIDLTFDIRGWAETVKYYQEVKETEEKTITLRFDGVLDFQIDSPVVWDCGEIRFDNLHGTEKIYQDESPYSIKEFARPYSRFYIAGHGNGIIIEFEESECIIEARFSN